MKRIIAIVLCALCFVLSFCSCSIKDKGQSGKLSIVTTIFPLYDFVRAIGGDNIDITLLIDPGTEVHSYDPKPSEIKAIYNADLFLYIGGESDTWVNALLEDKEIENLKLIDCAEHLQEHNHSESHSHHFDEHIWTSPDNAILMIEAICERLCAIDKKNAQEYSQNAAAYIKNIEAAEDEIRQIVEDSENKFVLVADRFPFEYFTEHFDIEHKAAFGGCAVSTDISIKTMSELLNEIRKRNLKYIYHTELSSKTIASALADETGVCLLELHSAHNVSLDDFNSGITYIDIMKRNAAALRKGML